LGGAEIKYEVIDTYLGKVRVLEFEGRLASIRFADSGDDTFKSWKKLGSLERGKTNYGEKLIDYFEGNSNSLDWSEFELRGSEFSLAVWEAVRLIPFGETRTYQWVAEHIGLPRHSRAVGNALGKNQILVGLPCHRVVCVGGGLGGYSAGVWRKMELLIREGGNYGSQPSLF